MGEPNKSANEGKPRGTPTDEKPFCWQAKRALKNIRDHLESSAIAVYVALTELASDARSPQFNATVPEIMTRAGIRSDKTVRVRLNELAAIGEIAIRKNYVNESIRAPSTYTILRPVINTERPVMRPPSPLPESEKNLKKGKNEEGHKKTPKADPLDGLTLSELHKAMEIRVRLPKKRTPSPALPTRKGEEWCG